MGKYGLYEYEEPDEYEQAVAVKHRGTYATDRDINDLLDDYQVDELIDAGIDLDELQYADMDERREILENAGLNPDEYEFLF